MKTNPWSPVKSALGWRTVVFCACKIINLFSVVLYLVRTVHEFDFRLVIKDKPNKRRPVESRSCGDRDSCFWQDLYAFLRSSSRVLRDPAHAVQVSCTVWSKEHYTFCVNVAVMRLEVGGESDKLECRLERRAKDLWAAPAYRFLEPWLHTYVHTHITYIHTHTYIRNGLIEKF